MAWLTVVQQLGGLLLGLLATVGSLWFGRNAVEAKNAELAAKDGQLRAKDAELAAKDGQLKAREVELALQERMSSPHMLEELTASKTFYELRLAQIREAVEITNLNRSTVEANRVTSVEQRVQIQDWAGNQIAVLEMDLAKTIPNDVLAHLASERLVVTQDQRGEKLIMWLRHPDNDQELLGDVSLREQGITDGSVLRVVYRHIKG